MRAYPKNRFVSYTHKIECPRCGFDFLEAELVYEQKTGLKVCKDCYDPKHLQDEPRK